MPFFDGRNAGAPAKNDRFDTQPESDNMGKKLEITCLSGEPISPILLVRDPRASRVIIADGYQRVCTVNAIDEGGMVPCKIV